MVGMVTIYITAPGDPYQPIPGLVTMATYIGQFDPNPPPYTLKWQDC